MDDADIDTDIHADLDSDDNKDESCGEAFSQTGEESDFEYLDDNEICDKTITLNNKKSIKDQLKFIIWEESLVTTFGACLICGGHRKVSVGNVVGSYCKIYVSYVRAQLLVVNGTAFESPTSIKSAYGVQYS